jgi:hypothetical protein
MQLETAIAAWALDEACLMIGRKFENLLNEGKDPFDDAPLRVGSGSGTQSYAPVAKGNIKRVKIKENGTW